MNTDCMHPLVTGNSQLAVQQTALLSAMNGHIPVVVLQDWVAREQCIAMIPLGINGIATIGVVVPEGVRQIFVLGYLRPITKAKCMLFMFAEHLLQKHHIGGERVHGITQLRQDMPTIEYIEALVHVDRHDPQCTGRRFLRYLLLRLPVRNIHYAISLSCNKATPPATPS